MVNDRGGALVEQPVGSTNREREAPGMSAGGGYTVTGGIQVLPHRCVLWQVSWPLRPQLPPL